MTERFVGIVEQGQEGRRVAALVGERSLPTEQPAGAVVAAGGGGAEEVLAEAGSARARLYGLLAEYAVDPLHSSAVLSEAEALVAAPGLDAPELRDLSAVPFVTIDNADSRDLDQAVFVEEQAEGYRIRYALADGAFYVRPGSALLEEALQRGTTFYLPGFCAPMLPPSLSEGLVSLNPGVERRALVFDLDLDAQGRSRATHVFQARIRSRGKLTYDGVQAFLDDPAQSPLRDQDYSRSLELLRVVGELRLSLSDERGVVAYNRDSLSVGLTPDGRRFEVSVRRRNDVERYNEQVSLLCNMEGAEVLESGADLEHVQPVFRVHPPPLVGRLEQLEVALKRIAELHGLDPALWTWRRGAGRLSDFLARIEEGGAHPRVLTTIRRQVRYLNRASEFSAESGPHHALGVEGYARFSSPMREVVGIVTHKEALEGLGLLASAQSAELDVALRDRAIQAGNDAKKLQRKLTKAAHGFAIDQLFEADLALEAEERPRRRGTIFGLRSSRLYVLLDDFPIELKVYRSDLEAHYGCKYRVDESDTLLEPDAEGAPSFRQGGEVALRVERFDPQRRRWIFSAEV